MITVITKAGFSDQTGSVWIQEQAVYYNGELICNLPPRATHMVKELTEEQLRRFDGDGLDELLSENLLLRLKEDPSIQSLLKEAK